MGWGWNRDNLPGSSELPGRSRFIDENEWQSTRDLAAHRETDRLPPICPDSPEQYAQMAAFPLPTCDAVSLQRWLYDEYRVEVPIIEWGGRQFVRVWLQRFKALEDIEALMAGLGLLLG